MNKHTLRMQDLPFDDRPYEKMAIHGSKQLTDAELLAIVIGSGYKGMSALDLSRRMLKDHETLAMISELSPEELQKYSGIGHVKALRILAALEVGRRAQYTQTKVLNPSVLSSTDAIKLMEEEMHSLKHEEFHLLLLNVRGKLIRKVKLSSGGLNNAVIYPRDIFREAIKANAAAVILCHNHPSGDSTPSAADIESTKRIEKIGENMGIQVLDHVIIARNGSVSLRNLGLI